MTAFERSSALALEAQLDGSATEGVDCGVAACVIALDDASYGLIRPSTEQVRKRMGNDRDATNPDQWKAAIDSYADRFMALGLRPPRTSVVRGKGHEELWRLLHDQRRRVIAAIGYGTVASEKRSLWASRSFRGNHAVYLRAAQVVDGTRKVPTYDPLADGRFKGCPNGRRLWPWWLIRAASGNVRDAKGRRIYPTQDRWIGLVVSKAGPIGEPDDGVDPGPEGALYSIIAMTVWGWIGFDAIIYLAALQGVPHELLEAAQLDGARSWSIFRNITLPLLGPATLFLVVFSTINALQVFDEVYFLTKGGPGTATYVPVLYLYKLAFEQSIAGYAAAIAYVLLVAILILTVIQLWVGKRMVYYAS